MKLEVGQKVSYPNQGACLVEKIERKICGVTLIECYSLRVLRDSSKISVPTSRANEVGIRPLCTTNEIEELINNLGDDFEEFSRDWKIRSREFMQKLQSGDVFQAADVLKKLTFLSSEKRLSFREQTLMEKAKFLVISEIQNCLDQRNSNLESEVEALVAKACKKHHPAFLKLQAALGI